MYFGYVDESGSPGMSHGVGDFLALSLVIFDGRDAALKCSRKIDQLRKELGKTADYEFHYSRNSTKVQRTFVQAMNTEMHFQFISIKVGKTCDRKFASYELLANILVEQLCWLKIYNIRIVMDSNPLLCRNIKLCVRKVELHNIHVKETKSHSDNLVQLTDYVVNVSCKNTRTDYSRRCRKCLMKKCLLYIEK